MKKIVVLVLPLLLFVIVPTATHAASASFFGPIISPACTCPGTQAPGWGCVFDAIQNLMNMGISFSFLILVLVLMYSGFLFMRSSVNPEMRSKGKSVLINAFIGIVIVLAAWLMVDFFMKTLYGGQFGPWNSILTGDAGSQCIVAKKTNSIFNGPSVFTAPGVTGAPSGGATPAPTGGPPSGNEAAVRTQFANAGVSIWHNSCPPLSSHCTNVGGMRPATISQTITVRNKVCGGNASCRITVTGGSEPGHAAGQYSHANGYKVDIDDTQAVNSVLNSLVHTGARGGDSGGPIFKDSCGNEYVHESTHWDITVYTPCGL